MTIKSRVEDLLASRRLGHAAASGPVFFFLSMVYAVEQCVDQLFDPAVALLDKKEYTRVMCRCLRSFRASSNYLDTDTVPMGLNIKTLLSRSTSFVRSPTAQNFDFVHGILSGRDIVKEMMDCTAELEGFSADLTLWLADGDRLRMPRYARDRINGLRADLTMRDADIERLQRDLEAKEDQLRETNSHIDKLTRQQSATGSSAAANVPNAASRNVIDKAEYDKLRDELEQYKGRISEYEAFTKRQDERLRNAIENAEAMEGELYNCGKSLKQANERIDELTSQLSADAAKVTHDASTSADSNEQAEYDALRQDLEGQRQRLAEYEEFTHRQDERLANSIANAEALETDLYASRRCLNQANAKIEQLEAQLKDLSCKKTAAEIKKAGSTNIAALQRIASLTLTIVDKQQTIGSLSTELYKSEQARSQLELAVARYEGHHDSEVEELRARNEERERAAREEERRLAKALTECLHDAQEAADSVAQKLDRLDKAFQGREAQSQEDAGVRPTAPALQGRGSEVALLGPLDWLPFRRRLCVGMLALSQARPIQNVLASCPVDHRDTVDVEPEDGNDNDDGEDMMNEVSSAPTRQIISGSDDQAENRVGEAAADDFAAGQKGERENAAKPSRKRSHDLVLDTTQEDDDEQNKPKPKRPKSGLHDELEDKLCQDLDKLFDDED